MCLKQLGRLTGEPAARSQLLRVPHAQPSWLWHCSFLWQHHQDRQAHTCSGFPARALLLAALLPDAGSFAVCKHKAGAQVHSQLTPQQSSTNRPVLRASLRQALTCSGVYQDPLPGPASPLLEAGSWPRITNIEYPCSRSVARNVSRYTCTRTEGRSDECGKAESCLHMHCRLVSEQTLEGLQLARTATGSAQLLPLHGQQRFQVPLQAPQMRPAALSVESMRSCAQVCSASAALCLRACTCEEQQGLKQSLQKQGCAPR